jgi:EAL domain-containing protein (putative c-di-GMP-specific phosphodiesterase class I)
MKNSRLKGRLLTDAGPSHQTFSARLTLIYTIANVVIVGLGLFWLVVLSIIQWWSLALAEGIMTIACLLTLVLIRRGHLSRALISSQITFYGIVLLICMVYDVPNAAAPRVTHLFFLCLALVGYINLVRERSRLQLIVIVLATLSFVVFASSEIVLPFATPLPDAVRVPGSWLNTMVAVALLGGCVYLMQVEFARASTLVREMQAAVFNNQFELFYQPQVDHNGTIMGAEALLRWNHPKRGLVPPDEFLPSAEQNGIMTLIGNWVLQQACQTLSVWQQNPATSHLRLAVNVSASQFLDEQFEQFVLDACDRNHINRAGLKLELTESVMVANIELVIAKMTSLRAHGVGTALDDFGTGYSSLGYLKRLPIEQLKIDRSFVQDVLENERSAALARNVIHLGSDLGMAVLAEGVETQQQFEFLRENGCTHFQGYLFGRPVPLDQFTAILGAAPAAHS